MTLKTYFRKHRYVRFFLYTIPILIAWFVLAIYPHLQVFPLALYKWSPTSTKKEFVGLYFFRMMFTYQWKETSRSILMTLLYVGYLFAIQTVLALLLALILQKNTRHNTFFRALFFLPMTFSSVMVALTWSYMYDPNLGIINTLLGTLGVPGYPGHNFFKPDAVALLCIVLVHIWANIGYPITIYTSGLQTISDDLYEAARLDGVNTWQNFWHITFPMLLPTLLRTTMLTLTTGAMAYDYVLLMGSRSANMSYDTWAAAIYKGISIDTNYGMVSAKSVLLFIMMVVICLVQYLATKKAEDAFLA